MANQNLLAGAVMLETMWRTRNQDLVDLISPFVFYSVAKTCSPHEEIDRKAVRKRMRLDFGHKDLPLSIIDQVFTRNPRLFQKYGDRCILAKSLDQYVADIDKRRVECDEKIATLGEQIAEYLSLHMRDHKSYSAEEGVDRLQQFFSRHGAFLGADKLEEHFEEIKKVETDYHIAQYIFEQKDAKNKEYQYVIELVKGYFLKSAIYLQGSNGGLINGTYEGVSFYYDTPFLLRLLGYKTQEDTDSAKELHNALSNQKGRFFFFPQTEREINGILTAYKNNIGRHSYVTLEGLDERKATLSDVQRIINSWKDRLKSQFNVQNSDMPQYFGGCIPINEDELKEYLQKRVKWSSDTARDADIESSVGIYMLRNGNAASDIEKAQYVFVTTNSALSKAFSSYYKEKINSDSFPLLVTDSELSALTWIKCGSTNDLPERDLLRNAYIATQPTAEMLDKFADVLDRMQEEGKITEETAIAIRTYGYTKKQVLYASFDGEEEINESLAEKIEAMLRDEYSLAAREDEKRKATKEKKEREHELLENARKQAKTKATQTKEEQLQRERTIVKRIGIALAILALVGAIITLIDYSGWILLIIIPFGIVTVKSVYDTVTQTEQGIDKWLVSRASKAYDSTFEKKYNEYINLIGLEEK